MFIPGIMAHTIQVGGSAAGTLFANAAYFDGSNDYLYDANMGATATTSQFLISFWTRPDTDSGSLDTWVYSQYSGAYRFAVQHMATGEYRIIGRNSSSTITLLLSTDSSYLAEDGWIHVLFAVDMATSTGKVYVNDVDDTASGATVSDDDVHFGGSSSNYTVGGANTTPVVSGDLAEYYQAHEYLDITVESNRRKFITADLTPADLGSDGSTPTGTEPLVYLSKRYGDFEDNLGDTSTVSLTAYGALEYTRGPERVEAAYFDGTNDVLYSSSIPSTGTKTWTVSFWAKSDVEDDAYIIGSADSSGDYMFHLKASDNLGRIYLGVFDTTRTNWQCRRAVDYSMLPVNEWFHCVICYDAAVGNGSFHMFINNEEITTFATYEVDGDYEMSFGPQLRVGGLSTNLLPIEWEGNISDVFISTEYIDLSVESNRRKFITAEGRPAHLGFDGSLPTGTAPLIYLNNEYNNFETNKGSGGDFTVTGALTEGRTVLDANGAYFDGTNDYMLRGGNLTGLTADSKVGTLSFWIRWVSPGTLYVMRSDKTSGYALNVITFSSGLVDIRAESETVMNIQSSVLSSNTWHHILCSFDMSDTSKRHLYVDDVSDLSVLTWVNSDLEYSSVTEWAIGASDSGALKFDGDLSDYFFTNEYIDLSEEANRRKFITADLRPVFLGLDGSVPTGTAPLIYLNNEYDNFENNKGSGGDFTVTGTLTESSSFPGE